MVLPTVAENQIVMGHKQLHRQCIYGPVPSRRLGRSLGIDLIPYKTCTYDCIYCQLGRTTYKTTIRQLFLPVNSILSSLRAKLDEAREINFITISGSGEPTLYLEIEQVIRTIKKITDTPVAVITNGSLLNHSVVREAIMPADLIIPSLDVGDEDTFRFVNRPHESMSFNELLNGLITFSREYSGDLWLEVMLISDITGFVDQVMKIADCVERIKPKKVQLNTPVRPPAENFAIPVSYEEMKSLASLFPGKVEIISDQVSLQTAPVETGREQREEVLALILRRPCTINDIAYGLLIPPQEALKFISPLIKAKKIKTISCHGSIYYTTSGET